MRKILILDSKNYKNDIPKILRYAVRGVIFIDDKLLLIQSKYNELKLPGGGIEENENSLDTLVREVKEETGYIVIKESITEFGEIEEKRLSEYENKLWHQINLLYYCDVLKEQGSCNYSESEIEREYRVVLKNIDEAISINKKIYEERKEEYINREYQTLLLIKKLKNL